MAQVKWTLQALDGLESICLFIARDAPQIAAVFADHAFRATNRPADYPRSGRIVPELDIENIREITLSNYCLIYRIREDQVQVVTVHHGARLLDVGKIEGSA
jgi:plasmid stabilization system protein ParE